MILARSAHPPATRLPPVGPVPMPLARYLSFPVLVVDEHSDAAASVAEYLRAVGFDAMSAADRDALSLVWDWHPSAAVVHLRLPGGTGYELAARLCEVLPRRPVLVATTGHGAGAERGRAGAFGFDHVLV